jgi:L-malate glycosyltransferase
MRANVCTPERLGLRPSLFIAHPSEHLTDHLANGDGLVAHGFISRLAARGYEIHVAADRVSLQSPLPENVTLYPLDIKSTNGGLRRIEYMVKMRLLYERLRRKHAFALNLQLNPVFPGLSLALLGTGVPLILGTYVAHWGEESASFDDTYKRPSGLLAKCRDVISSVQQEHADALLVTTKAAYNRIPHWTALETKIIQLPHGIDADLFSPRAASKPLSSDQKQSILFLANVIERKGVFVLLKAFDKVASRLPQSRLSIVGAGQDLEKVKSQILHSPHRDRIKAWGGVDRSSTPQIYKEHALYCLPSFGEPYATALIEAMACGLPVVSTYSGGTPELVLPGGGRLIAPGDSDTLADTLIEILSSPTLGKELGQENRRYVLERFAWDVVLDALEQIYFDVSGGAIGRTIPVAGKRAPSTSVTTFNGPAQIDPATRVS